jgi:two-component system LytT family response regulator
VIRCLLVDDEAPARQRLRRLLGRLADVEVVGEADGGAAALDRIAALEPDLVLLDIDMPELDGLDVAAALPPGGPAIVFATAYDEHALRAFELAAVDYLVKPVSRERLAAALDKVRARRAPEVGPDLAGLLARLAPERAVRRMAVRCGARYLVFDPARVSAIVARDHYSAILVDGRELLADDPLDALGARLDPRQFLRVHRGAILNLAFLRELVHEGDRRYVAVLADPGATRLPISRERLPAVKAALGLT